MSDIEINVWKICHFYKCFSVNRLGNLLVLSYGWSSGWSSINLKELNSETGTFAVRGLSEDETSFVISILYAGSFTGTCIVIPISQFIGIKRTIHLFGLPIIVSIWKAKNVKPIHCRCIVYFRQALFFFYGHKMCIVYTHRAFFLERSVVHWLLVFQRLSTIYPAIMFGALSIRCTISSAIPAQSFHSSSAITCPW